MKTPIIALRVVCVLRRQTVLFAGLLLLVALTPRMVAIPIPVTETIGGATFSDQQSSRQTDSAVWSGNSVTLHFPGEADGIHTGPYEGAPRAITHATGVDISSLAFVPTGLSLDLDDSAMTTGYITSVYIVGRLTDGSILGWWDLGFSHYPGGQSFLATTDLSRPPGDQHTVTYFAGSPPVPASLDYGFLQRADLWNISFGAYSYPNGLIGGHLTFNNVLFVETLDGSTTTPEGGASVLLLAAAMLGASCFRLFARQVS